uniref:Uncharacterized protein n=1 Tax=Electrophorus electricus TaxID=8005 RepID=A0AAY5F5V9_ELEEL
FLLASLPGSSSNPPSLNQKATLPLSVTASACSASLIHLVKCERCQVREHTENLSLFRSKTGGPECPLSELWYGIRCTRGSCLFPAPKLMNLAPKILQTCSQICD